MTQTAQVSVQGSVPGPVSRPAPHVPTTPADAAASSAASPLRAVLDAFIAGARSRAQVAVMTGLRPDTVDAAIEHLLRMGRLVGKELRTGCPSGGCGTCASGIGTGADAAPDCGAQAASPRRRGPALVELHVVR